MNLEELTTTQIQAAYLRSELSAHDLTAWYLGRIESLDRSGPGLKSINTVNEQALQDASEFDHRLRSTGSLKGPMDGVPVVIKDQVETAGIRTTFGSAAARNYMPAQDATVVKMLRSAGAIILAKTSMADFGASWFSASSYSGLTKNPYALDHDSGGSSSGTAVAVAANLTAVGVGGDTGGSVRVPSSFCNIVGLRVTPGLVSREGISPLVAPQDTAGPMARNVADVTVLLRAMMGLGANQVSNRGVTSEARNPPTSALTPKPWGVCDSAYLSRLSVPRTSRGQQRSPRCSTGLWSVCDASVLPSHQPQSQTCPLASNARPCTCTARARTRART